MYLSITNLLVQSVLLRQVLSLEDKDPEGPERIHLAANRFSEGRNQEVINMGSSWSNPTNNGEQLIRPVESVQVDSLDDARSRRLAALLKLNQMNHATSYHNLTFHNHMPHILGSAYFLGASVDHLNDIYDEESKELEPWPEPPEEIDPDNWRTHLGDKRYERAYLDFFKDELAQRGFDWKSTAMHFLLDGKEPLMNDLVEGFGHPLIHLGYAFEMENREVAMEALTIAAVSYGPLHEFIDDPTPPTPYITFPTVTRLLQDIREDFRYDGKFKNPGPENLDELLGGLSMLMWERFNSLILEKEKLGDIYENQVDTAVLLLLTGHKKGDPQYDFFLVHLVTTAHAMRVILPLLSIQQAWHMIRSHVVLSVMVYLSQCRPLIKRELVDEVDLKGKDWDYVTKKALEGEAKFDAHYVKALRAFYEFEKLFGKKDNLYLKAAVKFADEFKQWVGFGSGEPELDIKK